MGFDPISYRVATKGNPDTSDNINYSVIEAKKDVAGKEELVSRDYNQYPLYPVWGHEYLYSWYEKIFNDENLTMVWAGDSITLGTGAGGSDYHRSTLGKKILTLGGYPESSITSVNAGHGGQTYAHWIGLADTDNHTDDEDKVPNGGYLEEDMAQNPDLYVIGYGHNDGSSYHFSGSTRQERIDSFEQHLREGLGRIRTSDSFTTGNSYNKSPDELAIIIAMPTSANSQYDVNPQVWNDRIRPIVQKACRDFKCGYVDLTFRQYDHAFSDTWSSNGSTTDPQPDSTHPNTVATLDYMSMFKEILMPYLLQK